MAVRIIGDREARWHARCTKCKSLLEFMRADARDTLWDDVKVVDCPASGCREGFAVIKFEG